MISASITFLAFSGDFLLPAQRSPSPARLRRMVSAQGGGTRQPEKVAPRLEPPQAGQVHGMLGGFAIVVSLVILSLKILAVLLYKAFRALGKQKYYHLTKDVF